MVKNVDVMSIVLLNIDPIVVKDDSDDSQDSDSDSQNGDSQEGNGSGDEVRLSLMKNFKICWILIQLSSENFLMMMVLILLSYQIDRKKC